jgi:hypothetical protein
LASTNLVSGASARHTDKDEEYCTVTFEVLSFFAFFSTFT